MGRRISKEILGGEEGKSEDRRNVEGVGRGKKGVS